MFIGFIREAVLRAFKEIILPELQVFKQDMAELKTAVTIIEQRLDHTNQRIDDTNKRIDDITANLVHQSQRLDELNQRLDRLFEVIVRREEHQTLETRVTRLEQSVWG
jgi:septal ring factor EnvC (AmiA/AmiB activator)